MTRDAPARPKAGNEFNPVSPNLYYGIILFTKPKSDLDNWTIVFPVFREGCRKNALNCPNSCEFSSFSMGVFKKVEEVFPHLVPLKRLQANSRE